jgi:hypothetical protein
LALKVLVSLKIIAIREKERKINITIANYYLMKRLLHKNPIFFTKLKLNKNNNNN